MISHPFPPGGVCLPTSHGQAQAAGAELEPKAPLQLQTQLRGTEAGPEMAKGGWNGGPPQINKYNKYKYKYVYMYIYICVCVCVHVFIYIYT